MMQSVQVIIERLKTHPEDFFGGDDPRNRIPKFRNITDKLDDLLIDKKDVGHIHRLWYLEPEEKEALLAAYKEARRAKFEAHVFHTLLTKQEQDDGIAIQTRSHPTTGKALMQGPSWTDPRAMWQGAVPKEEGVQIVELTMPRTLSDLQQRINQQLRNEVDKTDE